MPDSTPLPTRPVLRFARFARFALRVLLSALAIFWLARKVDLGAASRSVTLLGVAALPALAAPFVSTAVAAVRWRVLLRAYGAKTTPAYLTLVRYLLVGACFNALPGAIAGDALRAYRTRRVLPGVADSTAVVLAERVSGLAGLLLLGSVSLLGPVVASAAPIAHALGLGAALATALVVAVFVSPTVYGRLFRQPTRAGVWAGIDAILRRIPAPKSPAGVGAAVLLSLLTQGTMLFQTFWLVQYLAPEAAMSTVLLVLPALIVLTYVPVTPGALGQRELVYVKVLGIARVSPEHAVAAAFVVFANSMLLVVVGGLIHLAEAAPSTAPEANVTGAREPANR